MIKLKDLLKESTWANRKFGEPLPTMADYKKAHNEEKLTELNKNEGEHIFKHVIRVGTQITYQMNDISKHICYYMINYIITFQINIRLHIKSHINYRIYISNDLGTK